MTPEQKAAYIFSQAVSALAELEAMKAANADRERHGLSQAYPESSFESLPTRYVIDHNTVIELFQA